MARTSLPPQTEAGATETGPEVESQATQTAPSLTMPKMAVIFRLITLAFLVLTVSLLASNSVTVRAYGSTATTHFNDIYAYRYAFSTAVIGLSYTFLHLLSSMQQYRTGKSPINDPKAVVYEFIGDKVVLALLGTGVGAIFGATVDLKHNMDELEDAFDVFVPIFSKLDDFFNRAYFPAIFLLIAFLSSGVSSILSSLALTKNNT